VIYESEEGLEGSFENWMGHQARDRWLASGIGA
jgi:hypothetical protein